MHSVIKARQVRYLVPVAAKLCNDYHKEGDPYSTHRLQCLTSLSTACELVDDNGLFLGSDIPKHQQCIKDFLVNSAALCALSFKNEVKQWPLRPKLRYVAHIGMAAEWLSPKAFWCYSGEHMVGNVAVLASSCLSGTPPHQVPETLCEKYRVGKNLQFVKNL